MTTFGKLIYAFTRSQVVWVSMRYSGWLSAQSIAFRLVYRLLCSTGFLPHTLPPTFFSLFRLPLPLSLALWLLPSLSVCIARPKFIQYACGVKDADDYFGRGGAVWQTRPQSMHTKITNIDLTTCGKREERAREGEEKEEEEGGENEVCQRCCLPFLRMLLIILAAAWRGYMYAKRLSHKSGRNLPPAATASTLCKKQSRNFCIFNEFIHCRKIRISKYTSSELT